MQMLQGRESNEGAAMSANVSDKGMKVLAAVSGVDDTMDRLED
jgi:hypothetical protein